LSRLLNGGELENAAAHGWPEGPAACAAWLIQIPESELKEVETSMEQVKQRLSEKKKGFFLAIQVSGNNFWMRVVRVDNRARQETARYITRKDRARIFMTG
jgi:hypothetical protein